MADFDKHAKALEVYKAFLTHLDSHNMRYAKNDDTLTITLISVGQDLPMPLYIEILEDRGVLRLISPIPAKMPEDKRVDGALAVAAANYGMINGCFDYDVRDGEIRWRLAMSYAGLTLGEDVLYYMMAISLNTIDRYNDRFYALAKGMTDLDGFMKAENG